MKIVGTGIDIVSIKRLEQKIKRNPGLVEKLFTSDEITYCKTKKNYVRHMAGRFAAKEAVYKAAGKFAKNLYWQDIEITNDPLEPVISRKCRVAKVMKKNKFICSLSISHENEFAVASSIIWEEK